MDNRSLIPNTPPRRQVDRVFNFYLPWRPSAACANMSLAIIANSPLFIGLVVRYTGIVQSFFFSTMIASFLHGGFQRKWQMTLLDYPVIATGPNLFFSREKPGMSLLFSLLFACVEALKVFVILALSFVLARILGHTHDENDQNPCGLLLEFLVMVGITSVPLLALSIYVNGMLYYNRLNSLY